MLNQNHNIIFNRILKNDSSFYFIEDSPILPDENINFPLHLCMNSEGKLFWSPEQIHEQIREQIQEPEKIQEQIHKQIREPIVSFKTPTPNLFKGLFYKDGRIGVGREPLYTYKFDIAVSENSISTAFHIGDGRFGFSMGNGTNDGFLPEIIGMGASEEDAGLYLIGRAGNSLSSNIPLIVIDGRNSADEELKNRPILGITSADYRNYKLIIDQKGNMEVDGKISAEDFIIKGISLADIIREYKEEIEQLKNKIGSLPEIPKTP